MNTKTSDSWNKNSIIKNESIHLSNGNLESINESTEEREDFENSSLQTLADGKSNELSISRLVNFLLNY